MRDRDRDEWRGRLAFAAGISASSALAVVLFSPGLVPAFGTMFGLERETPYPVRVELRPTTLREDPQGEPAVAADAPKPSLAWAPISDAEPGSSPHLPTEAAGRSGLSARRSSEFLPLDFDISPQAGNGSTAPRGSQIDIRKPISLNGTDAGSINVRVGRDSRIYLERAGLTRALETLDGKPDARLQDEGDQPFLSVDELRSRGLSVRYDPIADKIRLET